jgi:hypothetical protein
MIECVVERQKKNIEKKTGRKRIVIFYFPCRLLNEEEEARMSVVEKIITCY